MKFVQLADAVSRYFAAHNIETFGLTVVLEFQDFQSAARCDAALAHELNAMAQYESEGPCSGLKVNGINFEVRSPVKVRLMK